jgi:hypothetical protein
VSHADREQVIALLKAAFVQGRLTKEELDARVGQTFTSRTHADLAGLTADLPAGLIEAQPPRKPARACARPQAGKVVLVGTAVIIPPAIVVAAFLTGNEQLGQVSLLIIPWYLIAWIIAGAQMLANWHDRRSRRQLPPGPAQRGQVLEGEQDGGIGDDFILYEVRNDVRAGHVPGHGVIRRSWRSLPVSRDQRSRSKWRHPAGFTRVDNLERWNG